MNHCSGCGYLVPEAWDECRKCGAPLGATASATVGSAQGTSVATVSSAQGTSVATLPRVVELPAHAPARLTAPPPSDTLLPGSRAAHAGGPEATSRDPWAAEEKLPDTMLPLGRRAPAPPAPRTKVHIPPRRLVAVAACVVVVVGAFVAWPDGHAKPAAPVVLMPRPPEEGIPTRLEDVVRVQIESTRHGAVLAVAAAAQTAGAGSLTTLVLAAQQPGLQWRDGTDASEGPNEISAQAGPAGATVAVSSKSKVLCAFGRWSPAGAEYVTIKNATSCRATEPPESGWSIEAGGSARDPSEVLG